MALIGTVTGQEIKANRNGAVDVRLLQVRISNDSDIQTVQYMPVSGEDSGPINGDLVEIHQIGPAFMYAIGVTDQNNAASVGAGEVKKYSRDSSGVIAAFINWLAGGNLELNGNAYSAVRFQELQTAFNQLKSDFDTHNHPTAPVGPVSIPSTAPSSADITNAESGTVKLL